MRTTNNGAGKQLTLVGLGNIGSHAAGLLAKLTQVERMTLIDGDTYEESNLTTQAISSRDVGTAKVTAQARRLRRMNPAVDVHPIAKWVQDVPWEAMRGDVIAACLDSRSARCMVNEISWRLGVPWIDTGVDAAGLLARVNVYRPGADRPCLECAWNDDDYAAMDQVHACTAGQPRVMATDAPASLGAIAAGLLVTECCKVLAGDWTHVASGQQVLLDCLHHRNLVTNYRFNERCRFDHRTWQVVSLSGSLSKLTLKCLLARVAGDQALDEVSIQLPGHGFARRLVCRHCGATVDDCLYLNRGTPSARWRCGSCGRQMVCPGFDVHDSLYCRDLRSAHLRRSLSSIGFCVGDIISVASPGGARFYALHGQQSPADAVGDGMQSSVAGPTHTVVGDEQERNTNGD